MFCKELIFFTTKSKNFKNSLKSSKRKFGNVKTSCMNHAKIASQNCNL